MKPLQTKQYPYTGNYYGYTNTTSADGSVTEKIYATVPTEVKLSISVNLLGDLIIDSVSKMQLGGYLRSIVDKNGNEIYQDGLWEIFQTAPLLSGIGTTEGYRYRARIIGGNV